jgi:hypothetical protein
MKFLQMLARMNLSSVNMNNEIVNSELSSENLLCPLKQRFFFLNGQM